MVANGELTAAQHEWQTSTMVQIVCINKDGGSHDNPHEGISDLGWVNVSTGRRGRSTRMEMVGFIDRNGKAFVRDAVGRVAWLEVRTSVYGNKYVQTVADGAWSNNLLSLVECPV